MKKILLFCFYFIFVTLINANQAKSEIAFSFDNVNLVSVMNIISQEIKRNIIIDNNIETKVSLIINHPLNDKKIISSLQNSLSLSDLALFEKENGDLLIKKNNNIKLDAPVAKKGLSGFQIFIVRLRETDPNLMASYLSQFFPSINSISPSPNAKSITFVGNENDYRRLLTLIKSYDVKQKMFSSEIKIKNSKSSEVFAVLKSLLDSGSWLVSPNNDVSITNMPFSNNTGTSLNITYFYRRVSSSSYPHQMASIWGTTIGLLRSPNSGQWDGLPASDINFVDHRMKITGCYHIG